MIARGDQVTASARMKALSHPALEPAAIFALTEPRTWTCSLVLPTGLRFFQTTLPNGASFAFAEPNLIIHKEPAHAESA